MSSTVFITGASTGIGYCVAHGLKARGLHVIASCRDPQDVARLRQEGLSCLLMDVDSSDSIATAFEQLVHMTKGQLDALFCNAGFGQVGAVEDVPRSALKAQFETNVFGTWECIQHALAIMRAQQHGRIIVNSSILGYAAMPYRGAYNASKFALEGMCDTLRHELQDSSIFVSLIEPGPIVSQFRANALLKFKQHINIEQSVHKASYQKQLARLSQVGATAPFTLPAESCLEVCYKILRARHPKARYPITFPSKLFWVLRRLLPTCLYDYLLRKAV